MANVVVVGSQWGDEGKGKIVDLLTPQADIVARYPGRPQRRPHGLSSTATKFMLRLIPSGILHPGGKLRHRQRRGRRSAGAGRRGRRAEETRHRGDVESCVLPTRRILILPYHRDLEPAARRETRRPQIGTTSRGIGPAYEDKIGRRAIRVMDLADLPALGRRSSACCASQRARAATRPGRDQAKGFVSHLAAIAPKVLPFMDPVVVAARCQAA